MKLDPDALLIALEVEVFRGGKSRIVRMAFDVDLYFLQRRLEFRAPGKPS